jgi:protein-ribulosamine 3-kinase
MIPDEVMDRVTAAVGPLNRSNISAVSGGSINRSFVVPASDGTRYFLKLNDASHGEMFTAEREGLIELQAADAIRVPKVIECAVAGGAAFLLLEHLDLQAKSATAGARLGQLLARQHRIGAPAYGWRRDNTIGSTHQVNDWTDDWIRFFRDERLGRQFDLATRNGYGDLLGDRGRKLGMQISDFYHDYDPLPALLHGDLWGGNWGALPDGEPVIFDPAVYFGDREADIAMTQLFGGFGPEFIAAYDEAWPLDAGFEYRCDLYNLYHVLNHLNLFGKGYLSQVIAIFDKLSTYTT